MKTRAVSGEYLLAVLLTLSACSSKPDVVNPAETAGLDERAQVYIVSHGWHTGIVVPARLIQQHITELKNRFLSSPYLELGWGDKGFYQAEEITSGLSLQALFWPTESVMHVVAVPQAVEQYFAGSQVETLCLSGTEIASLIQFIANSFYQDANGHVVQLQSGIYGDSQFYQGVGDYYLMNTCNIWTAKGLKSAGLDIEPRFKLGADSVMDYLQARRELVAELSRFDCAAAATWPEAYHSIR